jgi:hypothetical protein
MRALGIAAVLISCSSSGPRGWIDEGINDCVGSDVEMTVGSAAPDPLFCGADTTGLVAICWDQSQHTNPAQTGPWCTYKNIRPIDCANGPNPGVFYVCAP